MTRRQTFLSYGALAVVCLVWGTTYLAIRIAVHALPDALFAGVRFFLAGTLLSLILLLRGQKFPPFRQWIHLAFVGVCLIGIANWLVVWAEKFVPSGPAALVVASVPFWMAALESAGRRGERWNLSKLIGLVIGFGGVSLLVVPEMNGVWDPSYLKGIVALEIACAAWALGSLYSKHKKIDAKPLVNAALQMALGGFFLIILGTVQSEWYEIRWEARALWAFVYLVIFGAMIGYGCYIYALDKLPSSTVSVYAYINPVIAVWLGWLILNEKVTWMTLLATVVILSGVWVVKRESAAASPQAAKGAQVA